MKTTDLNQPISSHKLNESMFKKFGVKLDLERYGRADLENYRNLLRTKVHQVETKSNFNDLLTSETYQKDKYIISILNQRIKEIVGESKLAERSLTSKEKKKKEEIVKAIKRDNPEKRSGKGKSSAYAIATAQAKKTAEGIEDTTMKKTIAKEATKTPSTWTDKSGKKHPATQVKGDKYTGKEAEKEQKVKEETRAPAKKSERTATLPSGAKVKATKVQGWQSQAADKQAKKDSRADEALKGRQKELDTDNDNDIDAKDMANLRKGKKKVKESQHKQNIRLVNETLIRLINEDEEGKAKSITAGTDMVNDFTSWMTRVGQYQTKSMIELADAIRANFGAQEAETFKSSVAPALETAINALTQCREEISNAVAVLAGEAPAPSMGMEPGMEAGTDVELDPMAGGDEFGASDAAAGGMETSGRERRESRELFARKLAESHILMKSLSR